MCELARHGRGWPARLEPPLQPSPMAQQLRRPRPLLRGWPRRWPSGGGGVGVGASRPRLPQPPWILPSGSPPTFDQGSRRPWESTRHPWESTLGPRISVRVPAWRRRWPWSSPTLPSAPSLASPCVERDDESSGPHRPQPRARSLRASATRRPFAATSRLSAPGVAVVRARKVSGSPPEPERWLRPLLVPRERPGSGLPTWWSRLFCFAPGHLDAAVAVESRRACPQRLQALGPMLLRSFRNPFSWEHLAPGRRGLTLVAVATAPTTLRSLVLAAGIALTAFEVRTSVRLPTSVPPRGGGSSGRRHLRSG
jgi:hypothetical protein